MDPARLAREPADEPTEELRAVPTEPIPAEPARTEPINTEPINAGSINTEQIDTEPVSAQPVRQRSGRNHGRGVVAGFAGTVAVAIVVLALGVLVATVVSRIGSMPGPTVPAVVAHVVGAGLAVSLYRVVSRTTGPVRRLAAAALAVELLALLWFFWWVT